MKSFTHYLTPARHYLDSNLDLIKRSINEFDWIRPFAHKHVDEKLSIFNKTVINILSNCIIHEVIVCDDKDPPWSNGKIKLLLNEKITTYNAYFSYKHAHGDSKIILIEKQNIIINKNDVVRKETLLVNNDEIAKTLNNHFSETVEKLNTFK